MPPAHGQDMTGLTIYSLSGPEGVLRVTLPLPVNDPFWAMDWVFDILSFLWPAEAGRPHSIPHNAPQDVVWHNRPTVLEIQSCW
jgi:hypothetical protein